MWYILALREAAQDKNPVGSVPIFLHRCSWGTMPSSGWKHPMVLSPALRHKPSTPSMMLIQALTLAPPPRPLPPCL
jgi:hypothetical protein